MAQSTLKGLGEDGQPIVFLDISLGGTVHSSPISFPFLHLSIYASLALTNELSLSTGEPLGRIKILLYSNTVPLTAENFRQFCVGAAKGPDGKPIGYKGARFHRIVCHFHFCSRKSGAAFFLFFSRRLSSARFLHL